MKKTQNKMQNKSGEMQNRQNGAENCNKAKKSSNGNVENCR